MVLRSARILKKLLIILEMMIGSFFVVAKIAFDLVNEK